MCGIGDVDGLADAVFRIDDLNAHCLEQFTKHWKCLDNHNHQLWQCRPFEWRLNKCVYENLVRRSSNIQQDRETNRT